MERLPDQEISGSQMSFIGKVLATFSHELKNHLAVIKEYTGLIHDLFEMKKPGGNMSEQCLQSLRSINGQIDKTLSLILYFNRFSHRMDAPVSSFDVNAAIEELLILIHRLANQRRVKLEPEFDREIPEVHANPLLVQFLLFCLIEELLLRLEGGGTIRVGTNRTGGNLVVRLATQGKLGPPSVGQRVCGEEGFGLALGTLGATVDRSGENSVITMTMPVKSS